MQERILLSPVTINELEELLTNIVSQQFEKHSGQNVKSNKEEFLTIEETIERLKITKPTLKRWSDLGLVKRHKVGGRVYYSAIELENRIKSNGLNS